MKPKFRQAGHRSHWVMNCYSCTNIKIDSTKNTSMYKLKKDSKKKKSILVTHIS